MNATRIHVEREGAIATVRMDGPDRYNVLDRTAWEALGRAVTELSADDDLRCVVLRGTGGRAFSAGSDIGAFERQRDTPEDVEAYSAAIAGALAAVAGCRHPTIAVIEGVCVGGGLEIAASCDLRVCEATSRFGAPIARLGLTMSYEELRPLVSLVGPGPVLEILLTGELLDAVRARALGLVSRIAPDGAAAVEGYALAGTVAAGAPLVHRWHKRFVRRLLDHAPLAAHERAETLEAFRTADYREGRAAFLEKRDPEFRGE
jgi:enoyl-CoA hydratase/carnithine racemase